MNNSDVMIYRSLMYCIVKVWKALLCWSVSKLPILEFSL